MCSPASVSLQFNKSIEIKSKYKQNASQNAGIRYWLAHFNEYTAHTTDTTQVQVFLVVCGEVCYQWKLKIW